jgi:DNA-binding GntR family transcriptional regulator
MGQTVGISNTTVSTSGDGKDIAKSARQRAGILRGDFPLGKFIEKTEATKAIGVSRTPVREALSSLGPEGYLVLHQQRGAMVKPVSIDKLFDLYDVRLMVKTHAARRIFRYKKPIPQRLFDLCNEHEEIAVGGDSLAFGNLRANLSRVAMLPFQLGVPKTRGGETRLRLVKALAAHDEAVAL